MLGKGSRESKSVVEPSEVLTNFNKEEWLTLQTGRKVLRSEERRVGSHPDFEATTRMITRISLKTYFLNKNPLKYFLYKKSIERNNLKIDTIKALPFNTSYPFIC